MLPDRLVKLGKERIAPYPCEGFVQGRGPEHAAVMLVGEAPGENEIYEDMPFIGRAGKMLMEFLNYAGFTREDVYITSAVRSRPYKIVDKLDKDGRPFQKKYNRTPNQKEIIAHAPLLDYEIKTVKPEIIITLGNIAFKRLTGKREKLTEIHGTLLEMKLKKLKSLDSSEYVRTEETYRLLPTFHPASIFYNRSLLEDIYRDLDVLKAWAELHLSNRERK